MDVGAVALKEAMRLDGEEDVRIAGRAAAQTRLAFAREPDARAVLDAGGNGDRERLLFAQPSLAAAFAAGIVDDAARAVAGGTRALDGEEALLRAYATAAVAGGTAHRLRARLGAGAATRLADRHGRHAHRRLLALERLLERDLEVVAEVVASGIGTLAAAPAHKLAEHFVEDVGKAGGEAEIAGATAAAPALESGVAEAVVGGASLIILQDIVGFGNVLELL